MTKLDEIEASVRRSQNMQARAEMAMAICPSCGGRRLFMGGKVGWHCVSKIPTCATNKAVRS